MSGLLVSVRDPAEAQLALAAGVDVIDLKEPSCGALAPVAPGVVRQVVAEFSQQVPISAACGELIDWPHSVSPIVSGLSYAKLGLARLAPCPDWQQRWIGWCRELPSGIAPVAVVYADFRHCAAPEPEAILELTPAAGCTTVLVDTYDKCRGGLLDHLPHNELARFMHAARRRGMRVVLAGSLTLEVLADVLRHQPDLIAVRGAACTNGRTGALDACRLERLCQTVRQPSC